MDKNHLQLDHLVVGYNGKALIHGIEIGVQRGEIVTLVIGVIALMRMEKGAAYSV